MTEQKFPLVSVAIATYNGERFIAAQLDSILAQTYPALEIVITDDASTDGTWQILQSYAQRCDNLRIYRNEVNLHYVKNFEKAMLLCKAEYIAPSDQDDIWEPGKISFLMERIGDNAIIYCNSVLIDSDGNELDKKLSDIKRLDTFDSCLNYAIGNSAPGHAMIIRRQVLEDCGAFPTMIPHDYWLGFVATFHSRVFFVDEVLVKYRQHSSNVFGAAKIADGNQPKPKLKKVSKSELQAKARERIYLLYQKVPNDLVAEKQVYKGLYESYQDFSLWNNCKRMLIFFVNNKKIMAYKRRNFLRRWLFCLKMFVKIE